MLYRVSLWGRDDALIVTVSLTLPGNLKLDDRPGATPLCGGTLSWVRSTPVLLPQMVEPQLWRLVEGKWRVCWHHGNR